MRRKFNAAQTSFHSALALAKLRKLNCRNPMMGLIQPLGGSTIALRRRYAASPSRLASLSAIAAVCGYLFGSICNASRSSRPDATTNSVGCCASCANTFSARKPASASTTSGAVPHVSWTACSNTGSRSLSAPLLVHSAATMICAWAPTAVWPL
jgi:hypothetical protein